MAQSLLVKAALVCVAPSLIAPDGTMQIYFRFALGVLGPLARPNI